MEVTQIKEVLERSVALADETVENGQNAVHGAPQRFAVVVLHRHRKRQARNSHSGASYTTAWAQLDMGWEWAATVTSTTRTS